MVQSFRQIRHRRRHRSSTFGKPQVGLDIAAAFLQTEYVAVVFPYGAHHALFPIVPGLPVRVSGQSTDTDIESTYTGYRGICPSVGYVSEGHVTNRTSLHTVQIVHG